MSMIRAALIAAFGFLALYQPCRADPAPAIPYAPAENLERIDASLIDTARNGIDLAAYVPTDWPIMQALTRTADRGVKVRIYLDGTQLAEREPASSLRARKAIGRRLTNRAGVRKLSRLSS